MFWSWRSDLASPFSGQPWACHKGEIKVYFQTSLCSGWLVCRCWNHVWQDVSEGNKDKLNWPVFSMAFKHMPETCRSAVPPLEISYLKPLNDIQALVNKQRYYQVPVRVVLWLWPWAPETQAKARESIEFSLGWRGLQLFKLCKQIACVGFVALFWTYVDRI